MTGGPLMLVPIRGSRAGMIREFPGTRSICKPSYRFRLPISGYDTGWAFCAPV